MNRTIIVGNWKLHGSRDFIAEFSASWARAKRDVEVVIAPPFPYLGTVAAALPDLGLAGQDCAAHPDGAFTGEVAASMLRDVGCGWVIVGHSERRQHFGDTNATVMAKARRAVESGLTPIICVGETLAQRQRGEHATVVAEQLLQSLGKLPVVSIAIAYEPVWAIGTGETATPEQADAMHSMMRQLLVRDFGEEGQAVPLLYGGSVKPDNATELLGCEHIDGALVGGASLKASDFGAIIDAA